MTYAPFAPGEVMTRFGATANWLYLIIDGEASVRAGTGPAPDEELMRLGAGEFFGELSLLTGAPRSETVVAISDVECFRLGKRAFQELLTRRPELAEQVAALLAERQRSLAEVRDRLPTKAVQPPVQDAGVLLDRIRRFFGIAGSDEA